MYDANVYRSDRKPIPEVEMKAFALCAVLLVAGAATAAERVVLFEEFSQTG